MRVRSVIPEAASIASRYPGASARLVEDTLSFALSVLGPGSSLG
jgi:hypothetical protein